MYKHIGSKRSKLKNFAPKILLCAQLGVLSVRNANIVFGGTAEELGILNFEFLLMQAAKPSGELFSASPAILNYSVVNYSRQGKLRRLWRLAVATQPPIANNLSVPLRGTIFRWKYRTHPQRRSFAACSGFHDIGPALRNPQLILNLQVVRGCVATAGRHSLLCLLRQAHVQSHR